MICAVVHDSHSKMEAPVNVTQVQIVMGPVALHMAGAELVMPIANVPDVKTSEISK